MVGSRWVHSFPFQYIFFVCFLVICRLLCTLHKSVHTMPVFVIRLTLELAIYKDMPRVTKENSKSFSVAWAPGLENDDLYPISTHFWDKC